MTENDENSTSQDTHALVGAYAVDALSDLERARFEAHLRGCAACREEVDGLRDAAVALGSHEEVAPPPALRDSVLAAISQVRPLPPIADDAPADNDNDNDAAAPLDPAATGAAGPDVVSSLRRTRRFGFSRTPLLVAAALVVLLAFGIALARPWVGDDPTPSRLTAAEQVLAADDAVHVDKRFPGGAEATVVFSREVGQALIQTNDMRHAPEGKVYQLWLQTPAGEFQSAGLMPDVRDATVLLEGDASRAVGVGITVEPAGGSEQPTSDPIAFFTLDT